MVEHGHHAHHAWMNTVFDNCVLVLILLSSATLPLDNPTADPTSE
jgi:hypothetical protein